MWPAVIVGGLVVGGLVIAASRGALRGFGVPQVPGDADGPLDVHEQRRMTLPHVPYVLEEECHLR